MATDNPTVAFDYASTWSRPPIADVPDSVVLHWLRAIVAMVVLVPFVAGMIGIVAMLVFGGTSPR